ncbi:MAG: hypothetical protein ACTHQ3_08815 [Motilibacteraceae bacterium]
MTTPLLDRSFRWLLDTDGNLYGDEQERLRWYEGTAAASGVQAVVFPWALAAVTWWQGRAAGPAVIALGFAYLLPFYVCKVYVARRRVRVFPAGWNRKRMLLTVLTLLPLALSFAGLLHAYADTYPDFVRGAAVGGPVGTALAVVMTEWSRRRQLRRELAPEDVL